MLVANKLTLGTGNSNLSLATITALDRSSPYLVDWIDTAIYTSLASVCITHGHNWDTSRVTVLLGLTGCINSVENWDTSAVTNMFDAFSVARGDIKYLANLNTESVRHMGYIFGPGIFGDIIYLSKWDLGNARSIDHMFHYSKIYGDISAIANWDVGSVYSAAQLFRGSLLTGDISAISGWNTGNLQSAYYMFSRSLITGDIKALSEWVTSSLETTSGMFADSMLTGDINSLAQWDTHNFMNINHMFANTKIGGNLSELNWRLSNRVNYYDISLNSNITGELIITR